VSRLRPAQVVPQPLAGSVRRRELRPRAGRGPAAAAVVRLSDLYLTTIVSPDSSLGRDALDARGRPARR
jgi:hypothetical protein